MATPCPQLIPVSEINISVKILAACVSMYRPTIKVVAATLIKKHIHGGRNFHGDDPWLRSFHGDHCLSLSCLMQRAGFFEPESSDVCPSRFNNNVNQFIAASALLELQQEYEPAGNFIEPASKRQCVVDPRESGEFELSDHQSGYDNQLDRSNAVAISLPFADCASDDDYCDESTDYDSQRENPVNALNVCLEGCDDVQLELNSIENKMVGWRNVLIAIHNGASDQLQHFPRHCLGNIIDEMEKVSTIYKAITDHLDGMKEQIDLVKNGDYFYDVDSDYEPEEVFDMEDEEYSE